MPDKEQYDVLCPKSSVNREEHYIGFPLFPLLASGDAVDLTCRSGQQLGIVHLGLQVEKGFAWP